MCNMKKVLVVGGVAGGASTAARLRRLSEEAQITIFERSGYVSFANCGLPYYLGGEIQQWSKLQVTNPIKLKARFNLDVRTKTEVLAIHRASKTITVKNLQTGAETQEPYDELVLAVGCEAIIPRAIPGIDREGHFPLRSLEDTSAIESWIATKHPTKIVVCGGGFIGLEIAEQLKNKGMQVHVVEAMDQVMAPLDREMAQYLHEELKAKGIHLHLSNPVSSFEEGGAASTVVLKSGEKVIADLVILAMGVRPVTKFIGDAGIELTQRGHIKVNEKMQTNDPHVWAVGDAVEVKNSALGDDHTWAVALGGPANRQGRICADNIAQIPTAGKYRGTIGASVVKVFDLTAASVGVNEKHLRNIGLPYKAIYLHPKQHAGYYPNALPIHLKLLFNASSGKIYGAQAVGKDGVEKRIDVISVAMHNGMPANELADLELCYAPPYGSARDPVNFAGMMAGNIMVGFLDTITPSELVDIEKSGKSALVVDVRDPDEFDEFGVMPIMKNSQIRVPLGELREAFPKLIASKEISAEKDVIFTCQTGIRAHVAACMARQMGLPKAKVLSGSFMTAGICEKMNWKGLIQAISSASAHRWSSKHPTQILRIASCWNEQPSERTENPQKAQWLKRDFRRTKDIAKLLFFFLVTCHGCKTKGK